MDIDYSIFFLFSLHVSLLSVKIWALHKLFKMLILVEAPITEKYMLVFKPFELTLVLFSFSIVLVEIYFIFTFFIDLKLYYYEYMSVVDQIFFTILTINYIKKETIKNGKEQN